MDQPDEVDGWPIMTPVRELPKPIKDGRGRLGLGESWLVVFALNLPVCLWFGYLVTSVPGKLGMVAGLAGLYAIGWALLRWARPFGIDLLVGGSVVLLGQFVPIAQIWAGMVGLHLAEKSVRGVGIDVDHGLSGVEPPQALIATLVTGGLLMAFAMMIGLISRPITPARWRRPKPLAPAELRDF